ncbi:MAG: hypothetical protein ABSA63_09455 [Thermoplasmata archaeon]
MSGELSGPLLLAVPSVVAFLAAVGWDSWARPALPPRFTGYAVRQGWQVDPLAVLDQDLRHEKLTSAVVTVRDRLVRELTLGHGLTLHDIATVGRPFRPPRDASIETACRAIRRLDLVYEVASRAEDLRRTDLWSRWRRPAWRATARRRFEEELSVIRSVWAPLEASS